MKQHQLQVGLLEGLKKKKSSVTLSRLFQVRSTAYNGSYERGEGERDRKGKVRACVQVCVRVHVCVCKRERERKRDSKGRKKGVVGVL